MKILLPVSVLLCLTLTAQAAELYRVEKVINGHTLLLSNQKQVRLIGVDASSEAAADFLRTLVEGKGVTLEYDEVKEDAQGNWLAYVLVIETFVNASLLYAGYAVPQAMPPNSTHDELFKSLYEDALLNHRGLWKN